MNAFSCGLALPPPHGKKALSLWNFSQDEDSIPPWEFVGLLRDGYIMDNVVIDEAMAVLWSMQGRRRLSG